jgi:hypothetical protein
MKVKGSIEVKSLRSRIAVICVPVAVTILASAHAAADGSASARTILVSRNAQGEPGNGLSCSFASVANASTIGAVTAESTTIRTRTMGTTERRYHFLLV